MIEVRDLSVTYHGAPVVHNLSLTVSEGERLGIIGMSGCGKSTLLRTIIGFKAPSRGTVVVCGKDVTDLPPHERGIAYMPQRHAVFPALSVWGNLALGSKDPQRVEDVAHAVRVPHLLDRTYGLSGGEERRVALGRALGTSHSIMLLDEPFSSLDAPLQVSLRREVSEVLSASRMTAVVVTHEIRDLYALCVDHVGIMEAGRLIQHGTLEEVTRQPVNDYAAVMLQRGY